MTVLVAAASKHGSTFEIAEAIGATLREHGLAADVEHVDEVKAVDGYDAVVLGSAAYFGKWMTTAQAFVDAFGDELAARPTWLFSSGPLGSDPKPSPEQSVHVEEIVERTNARDHKIFVGKLDRHELRRIEKAIVRSVHAEEGDFRDWDEIARWASGIADELA